MAGEVSTSGDETENTFSVFAEERDEMMYFIVHYIFFKTDGGGVANH